jgi:HlyD family secretion protein
MTDRASCKDREAPDAGPGRSQRRRARGRGMVGLLLGLLCAACSASGAKGPRYAVVPAVRGDIFQHVTASGSLSALVSVDVGSQVSGKISRLYVDFNSPVKKGELVAEIDPTIYSAQLLQADGDLASARADVVLKRQNLERTKILVPLKASSQLDLDQAVALLTQAEATVQIKTAALQVARANLGYCKITAPVDGIVIARKVDVGQTVIAAMSTPVLLTIAQDITQMNISADVSEADIGEVHAGQTVQFGVDAFPNEVFQGRVAQVRMSPTSTQNVVTYQTIIAVSNPERKLFPGMTADVSILVAERHGVVRIANAALRYTPPDGAKLSHAPPERLERTQALVYASRADGMALDPMVVTLGISDGAYTEAAAGVPEGAHLVTATYAARVAGAAFGNPPPPPPPQM